MSRAYGILLILRGSLYFQGEFTWAFSLFLSVGHVYFQRGTVQRKLSALHSTLPENAADVGIVSSRNIKREFQITSLPQ